MAMDGDNDLIFQAIYPDSFAEPLVSIIAVPTV